MRILLASFLSFPEFPHPLPQTDLRVVLRTVLPAPTLDAEALRTFIAGVVRVPWGTTDVDGFLFVYGQQGPLFNRNSSGSVTTTDVRGERRGKEEEDGTRGRLM